ncbi:MAG: methyltransferase domain-containing protein [Caldilineales bacterium]|nr:methyltransferase domain-containing protein [Caldilineales bacterium]
MNEVIRQRLLELNRQFYAVHAADFAATRQGPQPGWHRIIAHFPSVCQVLDLGCGNGRLAVFLDRQLQQVDYVGVDAEARLLDEARRQTAGLRHTRVTFLQLDLTTPDWDEAVGPGRFDVVVALAVLHHLPGRDARTAFVAAAARCRRPGGVLILSTWRFSHVPRLRRKIVPWETVGLTAAAVEPGDYLLRWQETGLRYVHECDESEMTDLAAAAGLQVCEHFRADGKEGDLGLYFVLL